MNSMFWEIQCLAALPNMIQLLLQGLDRVGAAQGLVVLRLSGFFSAVHGKGSFGRQLSERFLEVLLDLFREMSQQTVKVRGEGPRQHGKPCWCLFLCLCVCVCHS